MVQFFSALRTIGHDLRTSWYFRIYAFLWVFCALFTFSVLIILGQRSTEAQTQPTFHHWTENASSINFPRFRFRIPSTTFVFSQNVLCSWKGMNLARANCDVRRGRVHPPTECQAVVAEGIDVENQWGDWSERRIHCSFSTTQTNASVENLLVAFELEGNHIVNFGHNSDATVWIAPNNNAWILLEKAYITFSGRSTLEEWRRDLVYHSTVSQAGFYNVSIALNRFLVAHVEQGFIYDGWMAIGEIGGFAFFLVILHTILMMAAGVCLDNDSKHLQNEPAGHQGVDSLPEETRSML